MKNFSFLTFALLFTLISCGKEQFGSTPTSTSEVANGVASYEKLACAASTLVKPPVDIVYVVDNSTSTNYITGNIKTAIQNTINSISTQFDYRVIGTPLLSTSMTDFQVLASNPDTISGYSSQKISNSNQFTFFQTTANGEEKGFSRVYNFVNYHKSSVSSPESGLLRRGAHTVVILISNGTDSETTTLGLGGTFYTNTEVYNQKLTQMAGLKNALGSIQFRFMSVVAHKSTAAGCSVDGSLAGTVYKKMSKDIYDGSGASDSPSYNDSFDLCNSGFSSLFVGLNSSINQVLLAHTYNYWPITISATTLNPSSIKVYKQSGNTSTELVLGTHWAYEANYNGNSRILPTPGEPISGKAVRFLGSANYVTYPDCVVVRAQDYTEYFQYIVLPRDAVASSIVVRINGSVLPSSAWSYVGLVGSEINIKVNYNGSPDTPAVMKSGYMIKLNSPNYYKSGDNVEVYYQPAAI